MESIIQKGKYCLVTRVSDVPLHKHHCLNGVGLRDFAEKEGLFVYLAWDIHDNLHTKNAKIKNDLKRIAQFYYELNHTRNEWMMNVHKNYLTTPLTQEELASYGLYPFAEEYIIEDYKFCEVKI